MIGAIILGFVAGVLSAIIGVSIVLPIAGFVLRRTGISQERPRESLPPR